MKNVPGLIEPVFLHAAYPLCDPLVHFETLCSLCMQRRAAAQIERLV